MCCSLVVVCSLCSAAPVLVVRVSSLIDSVGGLLIGVLIFSSAAGETAQLEKKFNVTVITQNIDNLHERAGSSNVVHLHGEITKSRSTLDESLVYTINGAELKIGDTCEKGSQLRPHIVWFGEEVPMIEIACRIVSKADIFVVIGSSLLVYPAAGLIDYAPHAIPKFIIDPEIPPVNHLENLIPIEATAVAGVKILIKHLEKLRD